MTGYCDGQDLPLPYLFALCLSILSDVRINFNVPTIVFVCIFLISYSLAEIKLWMITAGFP